MPNTSPDMAVKAAVLVKGGFDKCEYEVKSRKRILLLLEMFKSISIPPTEL